MKHAIPSWFSLLYQEECIYYQVSPCPLNHIHRIELNSRSQPAHTFSPTSRSTKCGQSYRPPPPSARTGATAMSSSRRDAPQRRALLKILLPPWAASLETVISSVASGEGGGVRVARAVLPCPLDTKGLGSFRLRDGSVFQTSYRRSH